MKPEGEMSREAIHDSIARLFDGDLPEEGFAALSAALAQDPAARKAYLDAARLEVSLENYYARPLARLGKNGARHFSWARSQAKWSVGVAAAAVLAAGAILWSLHGADRSHGTATFRVCRNSEWSMEGRKSPQDNALVPGSAFMIAKGAVEISLPNDVRAVVEAPAAISLIDEKTLRLDYGRAFFRVSSPQGHGFTVVTPYQRVVDLGTAFGIEIRGGRGEAALQVMEGKVRIDSPGGARGDVLHAGRSVLLDGASVSGEFQVPGAGFLRRLPDAVETVFEDDFEAGLVAGRAYSVSMDPTVVKDPAGGRGLGRGDGSDWGFSTMQQAGDLVVPTSYRYGKIQPSPHSTGGLGEGLFLDPDHAKLTDGVAGDTQGWKSGRYAGFEDAREPVEINFDFGTERHFAELILHSSGLLGGTPVSASLGVSRDGMNFTPASAGVLPLGWEQAEGSQMIAKLDISGWPPARYYRLALQSGGQWMFLAEIGFRAAGVVPEMESPNGGDRTLSREAADGLPLAIEKLQPASGAQGVGAGTPCKIVFNKPVALGTGRVVLRNLTDGTEAAVVVGGKGILVEGNELTFIPPSGLAEGSSAAGSIHGWDCGMAVARINPAGDGTFYRSAEFSDRSRTSGAVDEMRGPTLATLSAGFPGAGIRRKFGEIVPGVRYNVSVAIGSRIPGRADFLGYAVRLKTGGTTLAEISGDKPPAPPNSMGSVGFSWDSSVLPAGVAPGDPLTLEIAPLSPFGHGYLDFDSVKVTQSQR